jgi:hypothetical protein
MSKETDKDQCYHGRPIYKVSFDLIESFLKNMHENNLNSQIPYFFFNFFGEYTHDNLALPGNLDIEFRNLLVRLEEKNYLDNTLLVLYSDHGSRLTLYSYRTLSGKLERKLPFLYLRLPKQLWNTKYHLNALNNKNKLIGAYDIHQTFRHFLNLNANYSRELDNKQFSINNKNIRNLRGISLFENIPVNRSCGDALIPEQYCSCLEPLKIAENEFENETNVKYENAIEFILGFVNNITEHIREKCVPFSFDKLHQVNSFDLKNDRIFQFIISFKPGDAWFEAAVKIDHKTLIMVGKVVRLSQYGTQSNCVDDSFLKNYCFCKQQKIV